MHSMLYPTAHSQDVYCLGYIYGYSWTNYCVPAKILKAATIIRYQWAITAEHTQKPRLQG